VVDTTGAGDLFTAGYIAGLLRKQSVLQCCRMGCIAGGAAIQVWPNKNSPRMVRQVQVQLQRPKLYAD
jgi:sugar/nucleoside kinase (ribokinase family)